MSALSAFPDPPPRRTLRAAASAEAGGPAAEGPRSDDVVALFALADRRCRVRSPSARDLHLRAKAARASGRLEAAQRDLEGALALAPEDISLAMAALAWGGAAARMAAAEQIVERPDAASQARVHAAEILLDQGPAALQRWRRTEQGVEGWIAWRGPSPLALDFVADGRTETFEVEPDPAHPLAGNRVFAAQIAFQTPTTGPMQAAPRLEGVAAARLPGLIRDAPLVEAAAPLAVDLTIIVPVYDDFAATCACLDALRATPPACVHRLVVVDDASPDPQIAAYLDAGAADGAFDLIRNGANLGYAGAVNRALATRRGGDVLLLNSDALPPLDAIDRLRALSLAATDVGTITPFSNNGELTSYPVAHEANPALSAADVAALDAIARAANGDALVDLPNGVGFCLYISAACLDAVGPLPEIYGLGYYEDVEFCLRARERGFRNVAAPGVFVGHAGSRSFGARKRALVARNLRRLESRFPGCEIETAAFVTLDPLAPFRAALDRARPPQGEVVLVACGPRAAAQLGGRRARELALEWPDAAVLVLSVNSRGRVALARARGGAPQSLAFEERRDCAAWLGALDLKRVECFDAAALPDGLLSALLALDAPFVLPCGDLGWFAAPPTPPVGPCVDPEGEGACEVCGALAATRAQAGAESRRAQLGGALERAVEIVPLDRMAESFARRAFKTRIAPFAPPPPPALVVSPRKRLGALYPLRAPGVDRLLLCLGRRAIEGPEIVVLGATLDDLALMASGRIFVTGPVDREETADLARAYGVDALLGLDRCGGFGELEELAAELGVPKAFFDWSFGAFEAASADLSLDPRICDEKAAARIDAWAKGEGVGSP